MCKVSTLRPVQQPTTLKSLSGISNKLLPKINEVHGVETVVPVEYAGLVELQQSAAGVNLPSLVEKKPLKSIGLKGGRETPVVVNKVEVNDKREAQAGVHPPVRRLSRSSRSCSLGMMRRTEKENESGELPGGTKLLEKRKLQKSYTMPPTLRKDSQLFEENVVLPTSSAKRRPGTPFIRGCGEQRGVQAWAAATDGDSAAREVLPTLASAAAMGKKRMNNDKRKIRMDSQAFQQWIVEQTAY
eukprot:gene16890-18596_t